MTATRITARCHCGAIVLQADLVKDLSTPARCTCSFCSRRQAANVSTKADSLKILKGAENLGLYSFGTHTAQHYFCKTCGIYTHHQRRSDPTEVGVNLGCIDDQEVWSYEPIIWHDGISHPSDAD